MLRGAVALIAIMQLRWMAAESGAAHITASLGGACFLCSSKLHAASKTFFYCQTMQQTQQETTTHAIVLRPTSFSPAPAGQRQQYRVVAQRAMCAHLHPVCQVLDQIGRALTKLGHTPHVTRHTPHVTRHTPHATRHTSCGQPAAPRREGTQSSGFPAERKLSKTAARHDTTHMTSRAPVFLG